MRWTAGTADITAGDPDVWAADLGPGRLGGPAADLVAAAWDGPYAAPEVLTHGEVASGNVVWDSGTVSGVADWSGAALGPASFDLGWCRLDLVVLHGERVADVSTRAYAPERGDADPADPLPGRPVGGVPVAHRRRELGAQLRRARPDRPGRS